MFGSISVLRYLINTINIVTKQNFINRVSSCTMQSRNDMLHSGKCKNEEKIVGTKNSFRIKYGQPDLSYKYTETRANYVKNRSVKIPVCNKWNIGPNIGHLAPMTMVFLIPIQSTKRELSYSKDRYIYWKQIVAPHWLKRQDSPCISDL